MLIDAETSNHFQSKSAKRGVRMRMRMRMMVERGKTTCTVLAYCLLADELNKRAESPLQHACVVVTHFDDQEFQSTAQAICFGSGQASKTGRFPQLTSRAGGGHTRPSGAIDDRQKS